MRISIFYYYNAFVIECTHKQLMLFLTLPGGASSLTGGGRGAGAYRSPFLLSLERCAFVLFETTSLVRQWSITTRG